MKIDSSGRIRSASPQAKSKTGKTEGGGFARHLDGSGDSASPVSPSSPVQSVDAVLALQTVGDSTSGAANTRARQWGLDTLDELEQIRTDLLLGAIPKERLLNLARMVTERRQRADDPRLEALLDDVELRVRVEIAKYEPRKGASDR